MRVNTHPLGTIWNAKIKPATEEEHFNTLTTHTPPYEHASSHLQTLHEYMNTYYYYIKSSVLEHIDYYNYY